MMLYTFRALDGSLFVQVEAADLAQAHELLAAQMGYANADEFYRQCGYQPGDIQVTTFTIGPHREPDREGNKAFNAARRRAAELGMFKWLRSVSQ